jgi:hypothetical protein
MHPAILAATRGGADAAPALAAARAGNCAALEQPLARLVAAMACLGDDATRRALM